MLLSKVLSEIGPRALVQFQALRKFASNGKPVIFTPIQSMMQPTENSNIVRQLKNKFPQKSYGSPLSLTNPDVYRFSSEDIMRDRKEQHGSALLFSGNGIKIHYGAAGFAPSATITPEKMLKYREDIMPMQFGILEIRQQMPFKIESADAATSFVLPLSDITRVLPHEENIARYSVNLISELNEDDAKRLNIRLQHTIFNDPKHQKFYEEDTSVVLLPKAELPMSATLMNFETLKRSNSVTPMHFHPGIRSLIIFTTNQDAGVELNFCGTSERPRNRPDCKARVQFPPNSCLLLTFPAFIHHEFWGGFACLSIHPKEGANLIDVLNSGKLDKGFLEAATVVSQKNANANPVVSNPDHAKLTNNHQQKKQHG